MSLPADHPWASLTREQRIDLLKEALTREQAAEENDGGLPDPGPEGFPVFSAKTGGRHWELEDGTILPGPLPRGEHFLPAILRRVDAQAAPPMPE